MERGELELLTEMLRDVRNDIKDLEKGISDVKAEVAIHSSQSKDLQNMNYRVSDLEKFRMRVKGAFTAVVMMASSLAGYFKFKGDM